MPGLAPILFALAVIAAVIYLILLYRKSGRVAVNDIPDPGFIKATLHASVGFYKGLSTEEQKEFEKRVLYFLEHINITAIQDANLQLSDRVLVAAAGIIPLFRFKNWFYKNLDEVLIYPDSFNKDFELKGTDRNITGMVGDGGMHRTMILSLPYLRAGFKLEGTGNTAIHEFIHLVDKADGATDGIPGQLLPKALIQPWVSLMHEYITEIRANKIQDINPYGATSETEFFAVVSEYFFKKPGQLRENHPGLYHILEQAFEAWPEN